MEMPLGFGFLSLSTVLSTQQLVGNNEKYEGFKIVGSKIINQYKF